MSQEILEPISIFRIDMKGLSLLGQKWAGLVGSADDYGQIENIFFELREIFYSNQSEHFKGSFIIDGENRIQKKNGVPISLGVAFANIIYSNASTFLMISSTRLMGILLVNTETKAIYYVLGGNVINSISQFPPLILKYLEKALAFYSANKPSLVNNLNRSVSTLLIGNSNRPYAVLTSCQLSWIYSLPLNLDTLEYIGQHPDNNSSSESTAYNDTLLLSSPLIYEANRTPFKLHPVKKIESSYATSFKNIYEELTRRQPELNESCSLEKCFDLLRSYSKYNSIIPNCSDLSVSFFDTKDTIFSTRKRFARNFSIVLEYAFEKRFNIDQFQLVDVVEDLLSDSGVDIQFTIYIDGYTQMYDNCIDFGSDFFALYFHFLDSLLLRLSEDIESGRLLILPVLNLNYIEKYSIYSGNVNYFAAQLGTATTFLSKVCEIEGLCCGPSPSESLREIFSNPSKSIYFNTDKIKIISPCAEQKSLKFNDSNWDKFNYKAKDFKNIVYSSIFGKIKEYYAL